MKICPTCGGQLNDDAVFCAACGNPVPATVEAAPQNGGFNPVATVQGFGGDKKKLITIIAAVAAAIVLIIVLFTTVFSSNAAAKRTVKSYIKAIGNHNAEKIVDMVYPKPILEMAEDEADMDKDDLADIFESTIFDAMDNRYGDDWKIKDIKIKKVKDLKKSELKDLKEEYDDKFDMKITDAKEVKVSYKIVSDDADEKETETLTVYKYKGKWYCDISMGF